MANSSVERLVHLGVMSASRAPDADQAFLRLEAMEARRLEELVQELVGMGASEERAREVAGRGKFLSFDEMVELL